MAKILAVDLDGTLFYPNQVRRCIPKKNVKFLRNWIDAGNKVVLVTSRSYEFTKKLEDEIGRSVDMICCTSCQVYIGGELVRDVSMKNETIKTILDDIKEKYKPLCYLVTTKKYPCIITDHSVIGGFLKFVYGIWRAFQHKRKEPYIISNEAYEDELVNGEVYKVMIFFGLNRRKKKFTKVLNKELREKYPELEFSWTAPVNEITPLECSKASGIEFYMNTLGINKEDIYVVGDSGNDITMFTKFHENSYCMKHAYTSVRKYAKHTISRVHKLDKLVLKGEKSNESN